MSNEQAIASAAFATYVNLSPRELEIWLGTDASAAAAGDGNAEGEEVLRVLRTPKDDRTADDVSLMRRVVEHIRAERKLRPDGDVVRSAWRDALMNWGHDPMTWSAAAPPATAVATPGRNAPNPRPGDPPAPGTGPPAAP